MMSLVIKIVLEKITFITKLYKILLRKINQVSGFQKREMT
jgi:hypothetical protein